MSSDQFSPPDVLLNERYQLQETLGKGGMGTVYCAQDVRTDQTVAIKMLGEGAADDTRFLTLFSREAALLERLQHPGIVQVLDAGVYQNQPFLVMEYVRGEDLANALQRYGLPAYTRAIDIAVQAASALGAAHLAGIIHCDVKPANLLIAAVPAEGEAETPPEPTWPEKIQVKVVDFGIAHSATTTGFFPTGQVFGTARYMAPEQATGEKVTPATDVYALGLVLYELLTGQTPFPGRSLNEQVLQRLTITPPDPRQLRPDIPATLAHVLGVMLARQPAHRYADGDRLVAALRAISLDAAPAPSGGGSRSFFFPLPQFFSGEKEKTPSYPPAERKRSPSHPAQGIVQTPVLPPDEAHSTAMATMPEPVSRSVHFAQTEAGFTASATPPTTGDFSASPYHRSHPLRGTSIPRRVLLWGVVGALFVLFGSAVLAGSAFKHSSKTASASTPHPASQGNVTRSGNTQPDRTSKPAAVSANAITVPNVVSLQLADAQRLLLSRHLSYYYTYVSGRGAPARTVISQSIKDGTVVPPWTVVRFEVSSGN